MSRPACVRGHNGCMTDATPEQPHQQPLHEPPAPVGEPEVHGLGPAAAAPLPPPLSRGARIASVVAVWAVALVLGVLIGAVSQPDQYAAWLSLALAVCVLLAFVAQLATQHKDGFVDRLAATLTGCFVVLGVTGAILGSIALSA